MAFKKSTTNSYDISVEEYTKQRVEQFPWSKPTHFEKTNERIQDFEERLRRTMTYNDAVRIRNCGVSHRHPDGTEWASQEEIIQYCIACEIVKEGKNKDLLKIVNTEEYFSQDTL